MDADVLGPRGLGLYLKSQDSSLFAVLNKRHVGHSRSGLVPGLQKIALMSSAILRGMSWSSVMGLVTATSQARGAATPCRINVPA